MEELRSGYFHFHMSRDACIRLAQMLYEDGKSIDELEELLEVK